MMKQPGAPAPAPAQCFTTCVAHFIQVVIGLHLGTDLERLGHNKPKKKAKGNITPCLYERHTYHCGSEKCLACFKPYTSDNSCEENMVHRFPLDPA